MINPYDVLSLMTGKPGKYKKKPPRRLLIGGKYYEYDMPTSSRVKAMRVADIARQGGYLARVKYFGPNDVDKSYVGWHVYRKKK